MDNRTLLAVVLSITVYYAWYSVFGPVSAPPETTIQSVAALDNRIPDGTSSSSASQAKATPNADTIGEESADQAPVVNQFPVRNLDFKGCDSSGVFTTDGGAMHSLSLDNFRSPYEMTPIYSWLWGKVSGSSEGEWKPYGDTPDVVQVLSPGAKALQVGDGAGSESIRFEVIGESLEEVAFRGTSASGLVVTQRVRVAERDVCGFDVEVEWKNPSNVSVSAPLWLSIEDSVDVGASGMMAAYGNAKSMSFMANDDVTVFAAADDAEPEVASGTVSWFGTSDRYFGMFVLPEADRQSSIEIRQTGDEKKGFRLNQRWTRQATVGANQTHTESFKVYVGPLDMNRLTGTSESLESVIQFGWFSFFARPLLWFLKIFYAGIGDWGFSIIMLTLMVKVIFYPLTNTAFRSSQAMAELQPKMQEMREKFKDKPEELNRRMVELFRENNVNPLGGCLPMILQMPVWFALYRVLLNSVELYHTEFFYIRDLSSIDPYGIMPAIVVALMVVQQSFMPTGNMDPAQARMMKIMPLIFGIFFFSFPAGLVLYIFVNMVLSIAQQWLIKRTFKLSTEKEATAT